MTTNIYLIRHAEAEGNKHRIFHGVSDSDLTPNGMIQAKRAAQKLMGYNIGHIYSSDLKRAYKTALAFSDLNHIEIIKSKALREIDGGLWENETWSDIEQKFPKENYTWEYEPHLHQMPDGESIAELYDRAGTEFYRIVNENIGRTIAIFTHGTFIKVLVARLSGLDLNRLAEIDWYENTAITKVIFDKNKYTFVFKGSFEHLDPLQATILNQDWKKQEA